MPYQQTSEIGFFFFFYRFREAVGFSVGVAQGCVDFAGDVARKTSALPRTK